MKILAYLTAVILLVFSASATVATFHGQIEKQGPKTDFTVGYATDKKTNITLDVPEKSGLDISYRKSFLFEPSQVSRRIVRQGKDIPLKQFTIRVKSENPVKNEYVLPVTLTAYSTDNSGFTAPRVVQERTYNFKYITTSSKDYGLNGGLIEPNESQDRQENSLTNSSQEENSLTDENQTFQEEEVEQNEKSGNNTTIILFLGVILVFTYTIYEAIT